MTVDLEAYENRLRVMLLEAVKGSHDVVDWTTGRSGVDWWAIRTPTEFDVISQNGYNSITWRIVYPIVYIVAREEDGRLGATRKKILTLLPQIQTYFVIHAGMKTDTKGHDKIIPGFVSGSFRSKYNGEVVRGGESPKRGMKFTLTFNHKELVKRKEV
jgi:hypothetical protein